MDLQRVQGFFDILYGDVNGYEISNRARQKRPFYDRAQTYGEVSVESMYQIITEVKPKENEVFYDLGSGTGKAVMLAAMFFPLKKSAGIELLDDLHESAKTVLKRYNSEILPHLNDKEKKTEILFLIGDLLEQDLTDGDIVFIHSTCFDPEMMQVIEQKLAKELKKGSRVITVTKTLISDVFHNYKYKEFNMAWGRATAFFYEKVV